MKKVAFIVICCILASIFATLVVLVAVSDIDFEKYFHVSESIEAPNLKITANNEVDINIVGGSRNKTIDISYALYTKTIIDYYNRYCKVKTIIYKDERELYGIPTLYVSLPVDFCGTIEVVAEDSNVEISNVHAGNIYVDSEDGDVKMHNVDCTAEIKVDVTCGALEFNKISANSFNAHARYEKIDCEDIDAGIVEIASQHGTIEIDSIKSHELYVRTSRGSINCYDVTAKDIKLITNVGGIDCNINSAKELYTITLTPRTKNCNVENQNGSSDYKLQLDCKIGAVKVTFSD